MRLNKKAQITIFIIIGIILVFSSALIFYIRGKISETQPPIEQIIEDVPLEVRPIQTYVQDCLEKISITSLERLGAQGGYIDPQEHGMIFIPNNPTESDVLTFPGNYNLMIPYWHYLSSSNNCAGNCEITDAVPPLYRTRGENSIESQLDRFISENLNSCLEDFRPFEDQGFTFEVISPPEVRTTIAEQDIAFDMTYRFKAKKLDRETELSKFYVRIPLNLKRIYNLAKEIHDKEIETKFLEVNTENLISVFGGVDEGKLPPIAYPMELGSGPFVMWQKPKVKEHITDILAQYTPILQATNTSNYWPRLYPDPFIDGMLDQMAFALDNDYYDLSADFTYLPWWPIYFDISPSEGALIKPDIMGPGILSFILPGFGIKSYQFGYDVSYPVLVELNDPNAFNGNGYRFSFALEANIRNNLPVNSSFNPFQNFYVSSFVCDMRHRNSGNITIEVRDAKTDEPLEDVIVSYTFGSEGCQIGETRLQGEKSILNTTFPSGIGILVLEKEGYFRYTDYFAVSPGEDDELVVHLEPYQDVEVVLKKRPIIKKFIMGMPPVIYWEFQPSMEYDLKDKEQAFVTLKRIKENQMDDDLVISLQVFGNGTENPSARLVSGTYEVDINLMLFENVTIPEDERCFQTGVWPFRNEECITLDEISLTPFPSGKVQLNSETGYLNISIDDLDKEKMTLFPIYIDLISVESSLRVIEDLEQLGNIDNLTSQFRGALEPTFE